jgi:DNA-binding transcriptional LysR family regulator
MDFEQLKTFLEVSRQKSFSRAADKLLRTQPAVSAQIRSLEEEVGARLFERDGGKVTFTAAGRLFEPFAENCLERQSHILLAVNELGRTPRGEISIIANEATSLYVPPHVFAQFKKQYSRVALTIVRAERGRSLEAVLNREVDFGVVSLPVKDTRLAVEPIHRDELVLVVPAHHPLAARERARVADLSQYPLLMPKQGRRREQMEELFRVHAQAPKVAMDVESSELLKRFILAGLGVGLLPRTNALEEERAGTVKLLELEGARLPRDLALVYRKDRPLSRAAQAFLEIASAAARAVQAAAVKQREK